MRAVLGIGIARDLAWWRWLDRRPRRRRDSDGLIGPACKRGAPSHASPL
jgi:hypothetical protein